MVCIFSLYYNSQSNKTNSQSNIYSQSNKTKSVIIIIFTVILLNCYLLLSLAITQLSLEDQNFTHTGNFLGFPPPRVPLS